MKPLSQSFTFSSSSSLYTLSLFLFVFSSLVLLVQSQGTVNRCPTQCGLSSLIPTTGGRVVLGPAGSNITVNSAILIEVNRQQKIIEVTSPQTWTDGTVVILYQPTGARVDTSTPNSPSFGRITNLGNAGNWEAVVISGVASAPWAQRTRFYVRCTPIHNYEPFQGVAVQAIIGNEVELLEGVTVTSTGWRAATNPNPVVPIVANTLILRPGASISADGKGFLGGKIARTEPTLVCPGCNCKHFAYNYDDSTYGARRGGSIASNDPDFDPVGTATSFGRGAVANGGGGGNNHNAPGGGGANGWRAVNGQKDPRPWTGQGIMNPAYTQSWLLETNTLSNSIGGGRGGYSFSEDVADPLVFGPGDCNAWAGNARLNNGGLGGRPVMYFTGNSAYSKLFLGGGGGAGHNNDWLGGDGGNGGGLIIIIANNVQGDVTNSITADGQAGENSLPSATGPFDGPGGGGAGGSIFFAAYNLYNPQIKISAQGGRGGNNVALASLEAEGGGGGGGGGVISFIINTEAMTDSGATNFGCSSASIIGGANGVQIGQTFMQSFPPNGATSGAAGQCFLSPLSIPCQGSPSPTRTRSPSRGTSRSRSASRAPVSRSRTPVISASPDVQESTSVFPSVVGTVPASVEPSPSKNASPFPSIIGAASTTTGGSTTGRRGTGGSASTTGRDREPEGDFEISTTGRRGTTGRDRVRRRSTTGNRNDEDDGGDDSSASMLTSTGTLLISMVLFTIGRIMM